MTIKGSQVQSGDGLTLWRETAFGYVVNRTDVEAVGGSRCATLPNSTIRIGDLNWDVTKDVDGKLVCWTRTVTGVRFVILNNSPKEDQMGKSKKPKNTTPAPEAVEVPKAARVVKPMEFPAEKEARAVGQDTKLGALLAALAQGATMEHLIEVLSKSGSPANASVMRSWLSYDVKRCGYGIRQDGTLFYLVFPEGMTEVAYKQAKTPEPTIKIVESEPKLKKAAGTSKKRDRKAERERRALKLAVKEVTA
jgi:hypothetical protein